MTNEHRVLVHPDKRTLTGSVAARVITKTIDLIAQDGEATLVLTGGGMGIGALEAINHSPARDSVDWSKVNFWWGDERWVPKEHADRNELQARRALLDHIAVDPARVHPFPAADEFDDLDAAAAAYAHELAAAAGEGESLPRFDITFLGVGPDGHIASLFPGMPGIREKDKTVIAVRESPKPPPERLSLTLPALNSSQRVFLVLAGADKASVLGLALAGAAMDEVPAAGVLGKRRTVFFVDQEAAAEVPENLISIEKYWTAEHD